MNTPLVGRRATTAVIVLSVLSLGACANDPDVATSAPTTAADATPTAPSTESHMHHAVDVVATDYAFLNLPEELHVGDTLTLANESAAELHEIVVFKLADDDERTEADFLNADPAALLKELGAPMTVLVTLPDSPEAIATSGSPSLTEAGRYIALCFVPIGIAPDDYLTAAAAAGGAPSFPGEVPHYGAGMVQIFEVVDAS